MTRFGIFVSSALVFSLFLTGCGSGGSTSDKSVARKRAISSARLIVRIDKIAPLVSRGEREIQIVVKPAAREDEFPGFHPVRGVLSAFEPGFVQTDHLVQAIVQRDSRRWRGVVEVED